jgi:hypothetical protein
VGCTCVPRRFWALPFGMFRLALAGPDTHVLAGLCTACPYGSAGCCVAPPPYAWSDLARVVGHDGISWLEVQIACGNLVSVARGFSIRRVAANGREGSATCVFHEEGRGCTIAPTQRPATCNYYVCDEALASGRLSNGAASIDATKSALADLLGQFVQWDTQMAAYVEAFYPGGPTYDRAFFEGLRSTFQSIAAAPGLSCARDEEEAQ